MLLASRFSTHSDASIPSRRRKCKRPNLSPATIVTSSGATAQHCNALSPVKLAIIFLLGKSQTLRVLSLEPEITTSRSPTSLRSRGSRYSNHPCVYASIPTQEQTKLRSPNALSILPTVGQNLCSLVQGAGYAACSRE